MLLITIEDSEDNERIDSDNDDDVDCKWKWSLVARMVIIDNKASISNIFYFFMLSSLMRAADDDYLVW